MPEAPRPSVDEAPATHLLANAEQVRPIRALVLVKVFLLG